MPKATGLALAIGGVALIVALIAGFLSWFIVGGVSFTLIDGYRASWAYLTGGYSSLASYSLLGSAVESAALDHTLVTVSFVLVLVFWPAMLVSGAINEVGRTLRWQPALWGILALVFTYLAMTEYDTGSVGYGAYALDLLAVILFLVAYVVDRMIAKRRQRAKTQQEAAALQQAGIRAAN